jgi:hypothetical protein
MTGAKTVAFPSKKTRSQLTLKHNETSNIALAADWFLKPDQIIQFRPVTRCYTSVSPHLPSLQNYSVCTSCQINFRAQKDPANLRAQLAINRLPIIFNETNLGISLILVYIKYLRQVIMNKVLAVRKVCEGVNNGRAVGLEAPRTVGIYLGFNHFLVPAITADPTVPRCPCSLLQLTPHT